MTLHGASFVPFLGHPVDGDSFEMPVSPRIGAPQLRRSGKRGFPEVTVLRESYSLSLSSKLVVFFSLFKSGKNHLEK